MRLLLDEHITPDVVAAMGDCGAEVVALRDWHHGAYLEVHDDILLQSAHAEGWTLVTYDRRTISPLLKEWGEQGIAHGGVVLVDERTIRANDIGTLARALSRLIASLGDTEWENCVVFLTR